VRFDADIIRASFEKDAGGHYGNPFYEFKFVVIPLALIDMPFSFVTDTLLLPVVLIEKK
jgi:uncharacterized protein YceK